MKKTIQIEGMSCMHCVKAVTDALDSIAGVSDVQVSLEEKSATLTAEETVTDTMLRAAIEEEDFEVIGIE